MSFANYTPQSSFWSTVKRAVGTQLITALDLYDLAILRVADMAAWLRDDLIATRANLASTTLGTVAKFTGAIDLATLVYDDITGTLNGLTFQIASDNSGTKTVTFGTGAGLAPTGPGTVVSQINTATGGNPLASVDSAGHLTIASVTASGVATINVVGGSAVLLLGFTVAAGTPGTATGGDGTSRVGLAAYTGASFNVTAGPLRTFIQNTADFAATLSGANHWSGVNTFANQLVMSSQFVPQQAATAIPAGSTAVTIDASTMFHYVDTPTQATLTVTLKSTSPAPASGSEIDLAAYSIANGNNVIVAREDATQITIMTGSGGTYAGFGSTRCKFVAGKWRMMSATGLGNVGINNP